MTKISEDLKEWCKIFENTDAELMAELYADVQEQKRGAELFE